MISTLTQKLTHYTTRAVDRYQSSGVTALLETFRKQISWRWRRIRMHPRFRSIYKTSLRVRRQLNQSRFTDADPFKLIYTDASEIEYRVTNIPFAWGRVIGGEWETERFDTNEKYQALEERFIQEKEWEEIECDVHDKEVWDTLYRSIQEDGYKPQTELDDGIRNGSLTWDCEVGVAIDADGEIHWIKRGSHRIRMAKLLDLDIIPVQVRVRHTEWQAIRDEYRTAQSVENLSSRARSHLDHPDLQDVRHRDWTIES